MLKTLFYSLCIAMLLNTGCGNQEFSDDEVIFDYPIFKNILYQSYAGDSIQLNPCIQNQVDISGFSLFLKSFSTQKEIDFTLNKNCIHIKIDPELIKISGIYQVLMMKGQYTIKVADLDIKARSASGEIESFTGPKTILAEDSDYSMLTVFPKDEFNNMTQNDSHISFKTADGDDVIEHNTNTSSGFGKFEISGDQEKKLIIGTSSDKAFTQETSILVRSGCPVNTSIFVTNVYPIADGRQFYEVGTDILKDRKGNIIEDGTQVNFIIQNKDNTISGMYKSTSIHGIATAKIKNPSQEGKYKVSLDICGQTLGSKSIHFKPYLADFTYQWNNESMVLGPFTSHLGQFLTDGTELLVHFSSGTEQETLSANLVDGVAEIDLDKLWMAKKPIEASFELFGNLFPIQIK